MADEVSTQKGNGILIKKEEVEIERRKWRGRRQMGWTALISMLGIMFILLFGPVPDSRLTILKEPITWFFFAMTSIIGAYMGVTAWAHIKGK